MQIIEKVLSEVNADNGENDRCTSNLNNGSSCSKKKTGKRTDQVDQSYCRWRSNT